MLASNRFLLRSVVTVSDLTLAKASYSKKVVRGFSRGNIKDPAVQTAFAFCINGIRFESWWWLFFFDILFCTGKDGVVSFTSIYVPGRLKGADGPKSLMLYRPRDKATASESSCTPANAITRPTLRYAGPASSASTSKAFFSSNLNGRIFLPIFFL